jgi:hypothetical protein
MEIRDPQPLAILSRLCVQVLPIRVGVDLDRFIELGRLAKGLFPSPRANRDDN